MVDIEGRVDKLEKAMNRANDIQRRGTNSLEARARQSAQNMERTYAKSADNIGKSLEAIFAPFARGGAVVAGVGGAALALKEIADSVAEVDREARKAGVSSKVWQQWSYVATATGLGTAIIAISLTAWPPIARLARAEALVVRNTDYVAAARLYGASPLRILFLYIAPMCIPSVIVRLTLNMAGIILTAASLGFLGLGAQPPLPEWGAMISSGRKFMLDYWWVAVMPGHYFRSLWPRR